mgnify:FL=1
MAKNSASTQRGGIDMTNTQRTFTIVEYFTVKASSSEEAYRLHKQKSPAVQNVSTRVTEKEFYD